MVLVDMITISGFSLCYYVFIKKYGHVASWGLGSQKHHILELMCYFLFVRDEFLVLGDATGMHGKTKIL
jgi:hypothetical protein